MTATESDLWLWSFGEAFPGLFWQQVGEVGGFCSHLASWSAKLCTTWAGHTQSVLQFDIWLFSPLHLPRWQRWHWHSTERLLEKESGQKMWSTTSWSSTAGSGFRRQEFHQKMHFNEVWAFLVIQIIPGGTSWTAGFFCGSLSCLVSPRGSELEEEEDHPRRNLTLKKAYWAAVLHVYRINKVKVGKSSVPSYHMLHTCQINTSVFWHKSNISQSLKAYWTYLNWFCWGPWWWLVVSAGLARWRSLHWC